MKRLAVVLLAAGLVLVGLAGPASADTGGNQRFFVFGGGSGDEEGNFQVVAVGPITGVGTFEETEDEDVVRFVFPEGTLTLHAPTEEESEDFNEQLCFGSFTFSGPWEIISGTGEFTDVTGSGRFSGRGTFVGVPTDEGCSEDEGFFFLFVEVTGTVSSTGELAA